MAKKQKDFEELKVALKPIEIAELTRPPIQEQAIPAKSIEKTTDNDMLDEIKRQLIAINRRIKDIDTSIVLQSPSEIKYHLQGKELILRVFNNLNITRKLVKAYALEEKLLNLIENKITEALENNDLNNTIAYCNIFKSLATNDISSLIKMQEEIKTNQFLTQDAEFDVATIDEEN